jgi:hypothetical protein
LTSGEGILQLFETARAPSTVAFALLFAVAGSAPTLAAGAFAIGKCGAYGEAYDYAVQAGALAAARKQRKGDCTTVTMSHACAALSIDLTNTCGPHGYAVAPKISSTLNTATQKCYEFGGKECVIRAWACDAKG